MKELLAPSGGSTQKANDVDPIVPRIPFQEVTTMTYCVGIQVQYPEINIAASVPLGNRHGSEFTPLAHG